MDRGGWLTGRQIRYLLLGAVASALLYAAQLLIDLSRPVKGFSGALVSVLGSGQSPLFAVTLWAVLASWLFAMSAWATGKLWWRGTPDPVERGEQRRWVAQVATIALLLPYTIMGVAVIFGHPLVSLACLPMTGLGVWLVRRMQRYRRMPLWLILAVFGGGALLAPGFAGGLEGLGINDAAAYLSAWESHIGRFEAERLLAIGTMAGVFEELGKGAAVAVAYLLARRYLHDLVSGIVLGAAAGLGFNLAESIAYISGSSTGGGEFQYWMRQSVGLMAAHTAFTAIIGAGFGVAVGLSQPRYRLIAVTSGYLAAAGSHLANDALIPRVLYLQHSWLHPSPTLDVLVAQPLGVLALQSPLLITYLLLVRRGVREQTTALITTFQAEAATGNGTVTTPEIPALLKPATRFRLRVTVLRRHGWHAYRTLVRLQTAQYELAGDRPDTAREQIPRLRLQLRRHLARPGLRIAEAIT